MGDIWTVISDWFHTETGEKKKKSGLRFADDVNESHLTLEIVCTYLKILLLYPKAMDSLVCIDVFEQIEKYQQRYLSLLSSGDQIPEVYSKTTEGQWKILLNTKVRLNRALQTDDSPGVFKKITIDVFHEIFVNGEISNLAHRRVVKNMFVTWMDNIVELVKQPIEAVSDDLQIEKGLNEICLKQPQVIFTCLSKVVEFMDELIKYRFYKVDIGDNDQCNMISYQYELLIETIFQKVILKNERLYSEIGKAKYTLVPFKVSTKVDGRPIRGY